MTPTATPDGGRQEKFHFLLIFGHVGREDSSEIIGKVKMCKFLLLLVLFFSVMVEIVIK